MTEANKIKYEDLKRPQEVTLAKCGWLFLVCIFYPGKPGQKFQLRTKGEKIFETNYLFEAVTEFNKLVV